MKHSLLVLGAALIGGGTISSCTYNTYVPPQEVRHVHHYSTSTPSTSKSASVGGSSAGSSAEGFQAVTPPSSYSQ
jgi:hypothetical protein